MNSQSPETEGKNLTKTETCFQPEGGLCIVKAGSGISKGYRKHDADGRSQREREGGREDRQRRGPFQGNKGSRERNAALFFSRGCGIPASEGNVSKKDHEGGEKKQGISIR